MGNIYLPELLHIASDPDSQHVFLLDSYRDASNFVDFLSITTCDGKDKDRHTSLTLERAVSIARDSPIKAN